MVIYTRWWWSERIEEWTFNKSRTNIRTSDVSLSRVAGTRVLSWHTQRRAQWSLSLLIQIRKILQVSWTSGWEREEGGGEIRLYEYIYIYAFSRRFYPKQLTVHSGYTFYFFISMCVPWGLNPQPFALLTQCSTTEPQERLIPVSFYIF